VATKSVQGQTVQDQVVETPAANANNWQRIVLWAVGLLLATSIALWAVHSIRTSDPYVHGVLQMVGNASRGREIFQMNCATCHGLEEAGEVGPDLHGVSERKSKVALIHQVTNGKTPPMPQFQPSEKDMADLLSFLETL
jgi:mono/diheme cytochrome c family protein